MRILLAALAASTFAAGLGAVAARAADAPEGYYEDRQSYEPPAYERHVERRVEVEEPSWRRVEIEEPLVEERVVVRRRVVDERPVRWERRVHLRREHRWEGAPVYGAYEGGRGRYVEQDESGW